MNKALTFLTHVSLFSAVALAVGSCKKDNSAQITTGSTTSSSSTITVAATSSLRTTAATDSIYLLQPCSRGQFRDSIAVSALPANVAGYLNSNYAGYTFQKAYSINNNTGTASGYVAVIYYNDKPVGLLFDANGNFVKVLEQREKGDLDGKGWHNGGRFEDRGGIKKDSVALTALPQAVSSYLSANFASDTLLKAFLNRDSSYLVVSKYEGLFATVFDTKGVFVKRIELPSRHAVYQLKELVNLSVSISSYLDNTYPNNTLKKAYSLWLDGTLKAYIVIIDANNTRYALEFDSEGLFVRVKTLF